MIFYDTPQKIAEFPGADTAEFRKARRAVARELRWREGNVMDWEVRSYIQKRRDLASPLAADRGREGQS